MKRGCAASGIPVFRLPWVAGLGDGRRETGVVRLRRVFGVQRSRAYGPPQGGSPPGPQCWGERRAGAEHLFHSRCSGVRCSGVEQRGTWTRRRSRVIASEAWQSRSTAGNPESCAPCLPVVARDRHVTSFLAMPLLSGLGCPHTNGLAAVEQNAPSQGHFRVRDRAALWSVSQSAIIGDSDSAAEARTVRNRCPRSTTQRRIQLQALPETHRWSDCRPFRHPLAALAIRASGVHQG